MKRILAPHKEQDGYVYIRVYRDSRRHADAIEHGFTQENVIDFVANAKDRDTDPEHWTFPKAHVRYYDTWEEDRIISSRKVEQAVETWEYLERCREEHLVAQMLGWGEKSAWSVSRNGGGAFTSDGDGGCTIRYKGGFSIAPTLREAYRRYKNAGGGEK